MLVLQAMNACAGGGSYLAIGLACAEMRSAGWSYDEIGLAVTGANLAYAGLVFPAGRCADRFGRTRTGLIGALLGVAGCALCLIGSGPWFAVAALVAIFAACGVFFPSNAGLFSDAAPAGAALPLHRKVSRYNLGWALGNVLGMGSGALLGGGSQRLGFGLALAAFASIAVVMALHLRYRPPPPQAAGDRAPHPALARLTLLGRCSLLLYCMLGMAMIGLADPVISRTWPEENAQRLAGILLASYAAGYFTMFLVLGAWSGWVLHPLRLLAAASGLVIGIGLLALAGMAAAPPLALLVLAGFSIGTGFAALYTASIYYSLRLPEGASRAAALHEAGLGIGSTLGPLLAGGFLTYGWSGTGLTGLAAFQAAILIAILALQAALIPGTRKLGATP